MAEKRPTVYDVAERAGVSIATVSHSFRRPERIRAETRETVLRAARELGYVPSGSARSLADGSTGALGLHLFHLLLPTRDAGRSVTDAALLRSIVADAEKGETPQWYPEASIGDHDPRVFPLYVDEIQRGFVVECRDRERPVVLSHSSTEQSDLASTAGRVDGIAVFPGRFHVDEILDGMGQRPVVFFSSRPDPRSTQVNSDNTGGMRALLEHLVSVHDVRSYGWVGETGGQFDFSQRYAAFEEFVDSRPELSRSVIDSHSLDDDPNLPGVIEAIRAGELPDAIICANDQSALVVMDALHTEGVRVPEDVIVTGFDDVLASQLSQPPLTTVRQQFELMGRIAAHLLMTDNAGRSTVTLGVSLVTRGSCGC